MKNCRFIFLFLLISMLSQHFISAQDIRINEIVASNTIDQDENGDTPDWIELYNFGTETVSLKGMTLSDDDEISDKWTIGDLQLDPDQYLLIWASGKDKGSSYFKTLIQQGDYFKFLIPFSEVPQGWTSVDFEDEDWAQGPSGFGYGDGDDATILSEGTGSIFLRKSFEISAVDMISELFLDIDFDDGFAAYINGKRIANVNLNSFNYNATTPTDREATMYANQAPLRIDLSDNIDLLNEGANVLSIQVHNVSAQSSDMSAIAYLTAITGNASQPGTIPPEELFIPTQSIHTNFKISSSGENISLYNQAGQLLDVVTSGQLGRNISIGIAQPGTELKYFETPTPGSVNSLEAFDGLITNKPEFSHQSGILPNNTTVFISGNDTDELIKFTTDGSLPTENSQLYQSGIPITNNTILRASFFKDNYLSTVVEHRSYFVDLDHDVQIISLLVDGQDFFDEDLGMYSYGDTYEQDFPHFGANFWDDRELAVSADYLSAEGNFEYGFNAGLKIFGGWSRAFDQRSLSLFARNAYNQEEFDFPFFDSRPYATFQSLILRNAGNDFLRANLRDVFMTSLLEDSGLDIQAYQPTATYINGQYWGLYFLREKINEHYLSSKHNIDPDSINLLENIGLVKAGNADEYKVLETFIQNNDLSTDSNYSVVEEALNIENFIIYHVAQIYLGNRDWPGNNKRFWNTQDRKWEFLLYDTDFGFDIWDSGSYTSNELAFALQSNGPEWPNPPYSTLFFRKLIQNNEFKNRFVNRYADELNSRFLYQNINDHLNQITDKVRIEMQKHFDRWNGNIGFWYQNIDNMRTFGNLRPQFAKQHILSTLNLPAYHQLELVIDDIDKGQVIINDRLSISQSEWTGDYFQDIPFKLKAVPKTGYEFSHWSGDVNSEEEEIIIEINNRMNVQANFTIPVTSTEDLDHSKYKVYPNPFTNELRLDLDNLTENNIQIKLLDNNGQIIRNLNEYKISEESIYIFNDLESLLSGTYFLELTSDNKVFKTIKILKI